MSRSSTPRRFIRSAMERVIDSNAAAAWVRSTDKGRLIDRSMPPGFSFTLSTNSLSAAVRSASDCRRRLHSPAASRTAGISPAPTPRLQADALMAASSFKSCRAAAATVRSISGPDSRQPFRTLSAEPVTSLRET